MGFNSLRCYYVALTLTVYIVSHTVKGCGYPGAPSHATVTFSSDDIGPGTVATHSCERGFELLGPARRICSQNGTWIPIGIPFCVLNVATGKAPMQSTVVDGGIPQKAVDGSTSTFFNPNTCSSTQTETKPWWYVNLLEPYMIQLVRVDFGKSCCENNTPATVVVRVGNNRPDLKSNPICNNFTGYIEEGRPLFLPCNPPKPGTFVSVTLEEPAGQKMSICETFVYTDQALPIERCPSFRDQPLGSTATYNGKCYIFYNNQEKNFESAKEFCDQRGGSLVDETSPALQGFISWELWRRHRNDPRAKYWMGATRNKQNKNVWNWINGEELGLTFWHKDVGQQNCSRFDGAKGWLWSDTNCYQNMNFICQHKPRTCGKPEQPTNSTLLARNFNVGSKVEYRCAPGHLLVGPQTRTCMSDGFFSDFPPKCKYMRCPTPYSVTNGEYRLVNGSMTYQSVVQYRCTNGYVLKGRSTLRCGVNQKWNGPPPTCQPVYCSRPRNLRNGNYRTSRNTTIAGTIVDYSCNEGYNLIGRPKLICLKSARWDTSPPTCIEQVTRPPPTTTPTTEAARTRRPQTLPPIRKPSRRTTRIPEVVVTARPTKRYQRRRTTTKTTRRPNYVTKRTRRPVTDQSAVDLEPQSSKEVPVVTRYPSNIANEIPDDGRVKSTGSQADLPDSSIGEAVQSRGKKTTKLNLGGIIALGVFGGFVFLAAIITIIIILVRRTSHRKRSKGSLDNNTIITYDSSSDNSGTGGLNKYYRKAWDNLRYDSKSNGVFDGKADRTSTLPRLGYHPQKHDISSVRRPRAYNEGCREANEIMVSDVAALYSRSNKRPSSRSGVHNNYEEDPSVVMDERSRGHGHKRPSSRLSARNFDDEDQGQSWYNRQLGSQSRRSAF